MVKDRAHMYLILAENKTLQISRKRYMYLILAENKTLQISRKR